VKPDEKRVTKKKTGKVNRAEENKKIEKRENYKGRFTWFGLKEKSPLTDTHQHVRILALAEPGREAGISRKLLNTCLSFTEGVRVIRREFDFSYKQIREAFSWTQDSEFKDANNIVGALIRTEDIHRCFLTDILESFGVLRDIGNMIWEYTDLSIIFSMRSNPRIVCPYYSKYGGSVHIEFLGPMALESIVIGEEGLCIDEDRQDEDAFDPPHVSTIQTGSYLIGLNFLQSEHNLSDSIVDAVNKQLVECFWKAYQHRPGHGTKKDVFTHRLEQVLGGEMSTWKVDDDNNVFPHQILRPLLFPGGEPWIFMAREYKGEHPSFLAGIDFVNRILDRI